MRADQADAAASSSVYVTDGRPLTAAGPENAAVMQRQVRRHPSRHRDAPPSREGSL